MKQLMMVCLLIITVVMIYMHTLGEPDGPMQQLNEQRAEKSERIESMSP